MDHSKKLNFLNLTFFCHKVGFFLFDLKSMLRHMIFLSRSIRSNFFRAGGGEVQWLELSEEKHFTLKTKMCTVPMTLINNCVGLE